MNKVAFIIPGYSESYLKQKGYNKIALMFKKRGINPQQVRIKWKYKQPIDFELYNKQFLKRFKNNKSQQTYIVGFSFGAMIALLTSMKTKPHKLILCSLSPYFKEDYKNIELKWLKWWKKTFTNNLSFDEIAKDVKAETILIVGDQEHKSVLKRARAAQQKMRNSRLIKSHGARHNINQKQYLESLEALIKRF